MDSDEAIGATVVGLGIAGAAWLVRKAAKNSGILRQDLAIGVLGEVGVGKTTLLNLWAGRSADKTLPTIIPRKYADMKIEVDRRKFLLRGGYDVGGSLDARKSWKRAIRDGYVIYLVDAGRLAARAGYPVSGRSADAPGDVPRFLRDARLIAQWRDEFKPKNWHCVIGVTHRDEDPRYQSTPDAAHYGDVIRDQLREVIAVLGGHSSVDVAVGSLVPTSQGDRMKDDIIRLLLPEMSIG